MQLQFKETKSLLQKEREAAKREAERVLVIQETLVTSLEKKIDETEKRYVEANKLSEESLKQALDAESKIIQLKTSMRRKLRRSYIERQHENGDSLINCVMKNIGFHHGKPISASTIYKCLLHWKSFEAEWTSVFDRLIHMIGSAIENQDDSDLMAYWLSNTSALLFLLPQSLKSGGSNDATPVRKPPNPTSLFGRMTMGFRSSPSSANLPTPSEVVRKVKAKYPALLFKHQLTSYVVSHILWDNLKKELASFILLCIQAPRTSKGVLRSGQSFSASCPCPKDLLSNIFIY
ncbi:myosin-14-like [Trifolium pratense]|uniref:myosin-14-like n=1 Tax=Trifolium pratense TaxID=57577 RepID=UPI001E69474F|nr:myosin-14-like [Trifolium pratense]